MSGAHRRTSRASLVLLQLLVFVTYIFGPTATFAEEPIPEPPTQSAAPEVSPDPTTEPTPDLTLAPRAEPTDAPSVTPAPPDAEPNASPDPDPTLAPEPGTRPYLVTFAPDTDGARQLDILDEAGAIDVSSVPQLNLHSVLLADAGYLVQLDTLRANTEIVRVEADRIREVEAIPSDTSYADQWSLPQIGWDQLYGTVGIGGTSTAAILDTGIDASHPDLDGVVLSGTSILDGSNGLTDPNGHGTAMAGIVAAETDNGIGIAGTAYAGVSILPVTVLGADGTGQDSDIIAGVVYASDAGSDVILMSFSNPGYSGALQAAIDYAWASGAVLVAATGNDGSGTATFPAGDRGVIGVASTDTSDALAGSSNYGPAAFMAGPGLSIATTSAGGDVATISGTSAAAASVAGAAALLSANEPSLSNGVIVGRLARNADPAGDPAQTGNGRLNLARAMSDASLDAVQPGGAAPIGEGGPLMGPYVAAAPNIFVDVAPTYSPGSTTRNFTVLVENIASSSSSNNYMGCIDITLPTNYSVAAAGNFTERAVDAGKVWATPTVFAVSGQNRGIRWIADANGEQRIANGEWARVTFTATTPAASTANWSIRANNNINCSGQNDTATQAVLVGAVPSRTYATTFIGPSTLTPGVPAVLQARLTRTGNMNIESGVIALPACVTITSPTIVANADSLNKGDDGSDWSVEVNDGVLRTTKGGGTQLDAINTYVQVQFTATASVGCALGTHAVLTSAMNNPWREGTNDVNKVIVPQGGSHPMLTIAAANDAPTCADDSDSGNEDETLSTSVQCADVDGDTLTYGLVSDVANGDLSFNSDGSFSYTPDVDFNGTDSFEFMANDGTEDSNTATFEITVVAVNDAPVAADDVATTDEDTPVVIDVLANDDDVEGDAVTISNFDAASSQGGTVSCGSTCTYSPVPQFFGTDTFTYQITDGNGGLATATATVTVNSINDAPVVTLTGADTASEGGTIPYSFTIEDVDSNTFSVDAADCGANGLQSLYTFDGTDGSFACTWADNYLAQAVSVTVSDDDAGSGSDTISVDIANVAPSIALTGADSADEGDTQTYSYAVSDPGDDSHTIVTDCGDDGAKVAGSDTYNALDGFGSFACLFPDGPALSNVTAKVTDSDGAADTDNQLVEVIVANVAPVVTLSGAAGADEGDTVSYSYTVADPGDEVFSLDAETCDGGTLANSTFDAATGAGSFDCTFADNATYDVSVSVADGFEAGSDTISLLVANVAPVVSLSGDASADEGDTKTYGYTVADPGADSFVLDAQSCGADGTLSSNLDFNAADGSGSFACTFADDSAGSDVSVTVSDDDGGSGSDTISVVVANLDPTVILDGPAASNEGDTVSYTFSVSDAGADTFSVDAADCGANGLQSLYTFDGTDGSFACTWADNYLAQAVSVTVSDDDAGSGSDTISVDIANVAPSILSADAVFNQSAGSVSSMITFTDAGILDTETATFKYTWTGSSSGTTTNTYPGRPSASSVADSIDLMPGCYSILVEMSVTDDDGGSANAVENLGGGLDFYRASFHAPIKNNERNIAKYGNVVPIKVELASMCVPGATTTSPSLHITVVEGNVTDDSIDDTPNLVATSVSNADSGTQMRANGGGYMYNFSTKPLKQGKDYTIRIREGSTIGPIILRALFQPKK